MTIGTKVLRMRIHAGLTQRALATRAHVPQPTISLLERGLVDADTIHLGFFRRLAHALEMPLGLLIHQEGGAAYGDVSQGHATAPRHAGTPYHAHGCSQAEAVAPSPARAAD